MVPVDSSYEKTILSFNFFVCLQAVASFKQILDIQYTPAISKELCSKPLFVVKDYLFWRSVVRYPFTNALATFDTVTFQSK